MSDRLKKLLGDVLYNQVSEAIKGNKDITIKDIDIIKDNFVTKSRFDEVNSKLTINKAKIATMTTQQAEITEMLKGVNTDNIQDLVKNYSNLTTKHKSDLELKDKEISDIKKQTKVREFLTNNGSKHTDLLMKSIDLDKISIDGDNLVGMSGILKELKTNYKDLFIEKQAGGKPPKNTNNNTNNDAGEGEGEASIFSELLKGYSF